MQVVARGASRSERQLAPPCRLPHVPSFFAIHIHIALMWLPSGPRSVKQEYDLGPHASHMSFYDRHQGGSSSPATLKLFATWWHRFQRLESIKHC